MNGYLLALHRGLGLTLPRYQKLLRHFKGDWRACYQAAKIEWATAKVDKKGIDKWFSLPEKPDPDLEIEKLKLCGAKMLIYDTPEYPIALQHISTPPVLLFVRGEIQESDWPGLAVVGSRRMSQYGKRATEELLRPVITAGVTIISGLAYGVDTLAHKLALQQGARTIAVLGAGIDQIYPKQNKGLVDQIIKQDLGAVVSEFLPGVVARPEYFPIRNRIIAGLSQGTLVVEAAQKSGTLITARYANEFGREVFAVPGEMFNPNAQGVNQLIHDGAHVALDGAQILEVLGIRNIKISKNIQLPTDGLEADILKSFPDHQPHHIDDITRMSGFPSTTISSNLMLMEIKGWIKHLGDQMYVRNV